MEWSLWSKYFDLSTQSWDLINNKFDAATGTLLPSILAGVDIRDQNILTADEIARKPYIGCYKGKRRRYRECITHPDRASDTSQPDNPTHNKATLYPDNNLYGSSCSAAEAKDHIDYNVIDTNAEDYDKQFEVEFANQYDYKRDFSSMSGEISACSK